MKDGEGGRNFHLEEVWIWGEEGMGEPWNKEKEPLSPLWLTSFPSLSLRKKTLSFLPKPLVFRSLIYLQLINIPLIILPRPVYSLIPSNEASNKLLLAVFSDYIFPLGERRDLGCLPHWGRSSVKLELVATFSLSSDLQHPNPCTPNPLPPTPTPQCCRVNKSPPAWLLGFWRRWHL